MRVHLPIIQSFRTFSAVFLALPLVFPAIGQSPEDTPDPAEESFAALVFEGHHLKPHDTFAVRFSKRIVDGEVSGKTASSMPIIIAPNLDGKFEWLSRSSGVFRPGEAPRLNQTYVIKTNTDFRDPENNRLPSKTIGKLESTPFGIIGRTPRWFRSYDAPRQPEIVLQFNHAVDLEKARSHLVFSGTERDRDVDHPTNRVPARVRHATAEDFPEGYAMKKTWREQWSDTKDQETENPERDYTSTLVVTPETPLFYREGLWWYLDIRKRLPSTLPGIALREDYSVKIGSILPFKVISVSPQAHYGEQPSVRIQLSKPLASKIDRDNVMSWIGVEPAPKNLRAVIHERNLIELRGDFLTDDGYKVRIHGGLPCHDGQILRESHHEFVRMKFAESYLSLPVHSAHLRRSGRTHLTLRSGNIDVVKLRVKRIPDDNLVDVMRGFHLPRKKTEENWMPHGIPFDLIPGTMSVAREFVARHGLSLTPNIASEFEFDFEEVLKPGGNCFFVDTRGKARGSEKVRVAQALIQLTDIGVFWKTMGHDAWFYCFSQDSGQPLTGATVAAYQADGRFVAECRTDGKGMARMQAENVRWLVCKSGDDRVGVSFARSNISKWRFGLPYHYDYAESSQPGTVCHAFTDRPLYQPGDEVHWQLTARLMDKGRIESPTWQKGELVVKDARHKIVRRMAFELSAERCASGKFTLPDTIPLGTTYLVFNYKDGKRSRQHSHTIRVEEFRPNTFEVAFQPESSRVHEGALHIPFHARYLRGQALDAARFMWQYTQSNLDFQPKDLEDFTFGVTGDSRQNGSPMLHTGSGRLDDNGRGSIVLPPVDPEFCQQPVQIRLLAEVTDVNQQTITKQYELVRHPTGFYLGVKKENPGWLKTNQVARFDVVAVGPDSLPVVNPVTARYSVVRIDWHNQRIGAAGNGTTIKNTRIEREIASGELTIPPQGGSLSFTPDASGTYVLTLKTRDAQDRTVQTRLEMEANGTGYNPWDYRDGEIVRIEADRESYRPGDVARITLKTPITGTAVVTREADKVTEAWLATVNSTSQVLEIPIKAEDAPNVFVSVIIVRGAKDSTKDYGDATYRIGYCQLTVKDETESLRVNTVMTESKIEPGQTVQATIRVSDNNGNPVSDAAVTAFAVDEGVLNLVEFLTPDPYPGFHPLRRLVVGSGTSSGEVLQENMAEFRFGNKGIVIGGGSQPLPPNIDKREDFKATAFWDAGLRTDNRGEVSVAFVAPDNLTRFRMMSVAWKDLRRMGSGDTTFEIDKTFMIEPVLPGFAREQDKIDLVAVLHNGSNQPKTMTCGLQTSGTGGIEFTPPGDPVLVAAESSATVTVPATFTKKGTVTLDWQLMLDGDKNQVVDAVSVPLEIGYRTPPRRELAFYSFSSDDNSIDLKKHFTDEGLEGRGELEVIVGQSRFVETAEALSYVLSYPYGCVEQTTSSLLPWIGLGNVSPYVFSSGFSKDRITEAISKGVDRLMSMRTESGALGYWPGVTEPSLWGTAYGGMGLALARRTGANVPDTVIEDLTRYLSRELRSMNSAKGYRRDTLALGSYTLSLFDKGEPAYLEKLYNNRSSLSRLSLVYLTLAMLEEGKYTEEVATLLDATYHSEKKGSWFGSHAYRAMHLLAACRAGRNEEAHSLAAEIMKKRRPEGHWGNTYGNGWTIMGMAAYAQEYERNHATGIRSLVLDGTDYPVQLDPDTGNGRVVVAVHDVKGKLRLETKENEVFHVCLRLETRVESPTLGAVRNGLGVERRYYRLHNDGRRERADHFEIGDLVEIELDLSVPKYTPYLAVADPVPAAFEVIQSGFSGRDRFGTSKKSRWYRSFYTNHTELRKDRALFFRDYGYSGEYTLRYRARVISSGKMLAPPSMIEAMYDPDRRGQSDATIIHSRLGN